MKSTNPKTSAAPPVPIDISKAKSKPRSAKLSTDTSPSSEVTPDGEPSADFTLRQRRFLQLLREGNNITMGCAILGVTRHAYHQWRRRTEGFRAAVAAAREVHRQEVACAFHDADAYARSLIDMVQRDQSLPAAIRLRAANQLLRRPGLKDWLPSPLPEDPDPEDPANDAPLALPGFPHFADEILPESAPQAPESAQAEAQSCDVPSQSASAAAGGNLADLSAPKPAEPLPSKAIANPNHPVPNAYNAYPPEAKAQATNPQQNQQYPAMPPSPRSASQTENHAYNAYAATPSQPGQPKASAASASPCPSPSPSLTETWLNRTFLQAHESRKAFESFLQNHIRTYAPATAPEELLVFRITQKAWLLRRIETWERVITDSRVAKIREKHPNAAAPACIALSLLEVKESSQTRFYERTAKLRKEHEDALDRLTARLDTLQLRRETNTRREERRPFAYQQLAAFETAFPSAS